MPRYDFRLTAIIQTLDSGIHLAEALFFPEVSRFGEDRGRLQEALKSNASRIVEELPPLELHMRRAGAAPEIGEVTLLLDPPSQSVAWRKPVSLSFDVIRFSHAGETEIAYIPALGIEVLAKDAQELQVLIPAQIRAYLLRSKQATSLGNLVWLQRSQVVLVAESSFSATLRTPKQIAMSFEASSESKKSVLEEVGTDLAQGRLPESYEMDDVVARIAEALTGRAPRSVLLVGPSGVGKTAAVYELVRQRNKFHLGRTPFWATSGSRLVAGMSGFGMWQERCGRLAREASKQKAILHLGSLLELMEVGKSISNSQGIAGFLRPYLSRGDLVAIAEATAEQLPLIERSDPHLLDAFLQIKVEEPSAEKGKAILLGYIVSSSPNDTPIDIEAIETFDRLHRRYATYSAYPGRPLRFLKNLLQDREQGVTLTAEDVTTRFSEETGLPLFLLNDSIKLDLNDTQRWFGERVIGQPEAVGLVVDLLATIKAGLTRPRKPIASLLFIGPTGVGKTEMAKSLAEFLFRDRGRMIRFDMSEYTDVVGVGRLIGGVWGSEGLLTSKVREQPFAVILLDEFEKAHASFFDLLLQVLGEGRLTDGAGRVADFSNSVVIMTSNLGAETFKRSSIGFGDESPTAKAREHFLKEVRAFVRPEFFNRIDRIIPFAPLDGETVLQIAEREIERLKKRDGILFRGVTLKLSDEVTRHLARRGYDPRYGARPLKRAVERELLVPLSEGFNRQGGDAALLADVRVDGEGLSVSVQAMTDYSGKQVMRDAALVDLATRTAALRRDAQGLERSAAVVEVRSEIFRLEQLEKRLSSKTWKSAEDLYELTRLPELKRGAKHLRSLFEKASSLEDEVLLCLYGKGACDKDRFASELSAASREWQEVLLSIYALQFKKSDYVTLAVYSENSKWLFELARAYYSITTGAGADVKVCEFKALTADEVEALDSEQQKSDKKKRTEKYNLLGRIAIKQTVDKPEEFLAEPRGSAVGVAMGVRAPLAYPRYEPERGVHLLTEEKHAHKALVHTSEAQLIEYKPPADIERRASIGPQERRRAYDFKEAAVEDAVLKKKFPLYGDNLGEALARAIEYRIVEDAKSLLDDSPNN